MNGRDVAKAIIKRSSSKQTEIADRLGISKELLWNHLNSNTEHDIPVDILNDIVRSVGYKVVCVSSKSEVKKDEYEINS